MTASKKPKRQSSLSATRKTGRAGERVSLYPLSTEEATWALLRVPPELKEKRRDQQKPKGKSK